MSAKLYENFEPRFTRLRLFLFEKLRRRSHKSLYKNRTFPVECADIKTAPMSFRFSLYSSGLFAFQIYTRARKLTPRMLNELVEKIEVYNAEKIDGEWVQRLRIHYNCVGEMNIPNEPALPIPAVTVNTRKGVFVSYTTDDRPAV